MYEAYEKQKNGTGSKIRQLNWLSWLLDSCFGTEVTIANIQLLLNMGPNYGRGTVISNLVSSSSISSIKFYGT